MKGIGCDNTMTELPETTKQAIRDLKIKFDEDLAQGFLLLQPDTIKWTPETGWLIWGGTHWRAELAEQRVRAAVVNALKVMRTIYSEVDQDDEYKRQLSKTSPNVRNVNNTITMLQSNPEVYISYSFFDNSPNRLNCKNGVVDLRTGSIEPHEPNQFFTYCLNTEYNPDAKPILWKDFLSQVVGGGQVVIDFIKRAVGYSLTGHTSEEVLLYVHGPTRSGKGTFANTLLHLLGKPLSAGVGFEMFQSTRSGDSQNFDLAELVPTRLIIASESDRHARLNAAMLKRLTGGDDIFCAKKGKQPFTYKPQSLIWLFSNFAANLDVDDSAAWYRLLVVLFPHSMKGKEDKTLKARLLSKESLEGILAWAIQGAMEWYKDGLNPPNVIREQAESDRADMDYVWRFVVERCAVCEDGAVLSTDLYHEYKQWAEDEGYPCKNQGQFVSTLKIKGFTTQKRRATRLENPKSHILGLKIA